MQKRANWYFCFLKALPNGVINPAFEGNIDTVNIDGNNSWSDDTSSDNMKDGSRASTLTRQIEKAAAEEPQLPVENKYLTYPPKHTVM